MRRRFCSALLCLCIGAPVSAIATPTQLELVNRRVNGTELELKGVRNELARINSQLTQLSEDRDRLKQEENLLRQEISENELAIADANLNLTEVAARISLRKDLSPRRLRAIYYMGREQAQVSGAGGRSAQHQFYLAKIAQADKSNLESDNSLLALQESRREDLERLNEKQKQAQANLSKRSSGLSAIAEDHKKKTKLLSKEEERVGALLTKLRSEALRLETVLSSLISQTPQSDGHLLGHKKVVVPAYEGQGLFTLKGSLLRPVKGKVVRGFGSRNPSSFKDMVFSKGVELSVQEESEVMAIAAGRVVHVGSLPAFGDFIVLDHGKRYYSLYGKLAHILVDKGSDVERGDVVGRVGAQADNEGNFYFEIRNAGQAVNPSSYSIQF